MRHSRRMASTVLFLDGRAPTRLTLSPRGEAMGESAGPPVLLSGLAAWVLGKDGIREYPRRFL